MEKKNHKKKVQLELEILELEQKLTPFADTDPNDPMNGCLQSCEGKININNGAEC
ncbi:MAG: hypothetical protein KDD48_07280 [Bdellovibrionales bacterium]|nr:hypothetical protein [Bdellovibrionales bacterium]